MFFLLFVDPGDDLEVEVVRRSNSSGTEGAGDEYRRCDDNDDDDWDIATKEKGEQWRLAINKVVNTRHKVRVGHPF